jgi:hypothetical protein
MVNYIEKVFSTLAAIPCDKWIHFGVGTYTYVFLGLFISNLLAMVIVICIAIGKEIYDSTKDNHTSDYMDAIATSSGAITLTLVEALI